MQDAATQVANAQVMALLKFIGELSVYFAQMIERGIIKTDEFRTDIYGSSAFGKGVRISNMDLYVMKGLSKEEAEACIKAYNVRGKAFADERTGVVYITAHKKDWNKIQTMTRDINNGKFNVDTLSAEEYQPGTEEKISEDKSQQKENEWIEEPDMPDWEVGPHVPEEKEASRTFKREMPQEVTEDAPAVPEYDIIAQEPSGTALYGEVVFTYSPTLDGEYTSDLPDKPGTWYMKAEVEETNEYEGLSRIVSFRVKEYEKDLEEEMELGLVSDEEETPEETAAQENKTEEDVIVTFPPDLDNGTDETKSDRELARERAANARAEYLENARNEREDYLNSRTPSSGLAHSQDLKTQPSPEVISPVVVNPYANAVNIQDYANKEYNNTPNQENTADSGSTAFSQYQGEQEPLKEGSAQEYDNYTPDKTETQEGASKHYPVYENAKTKEHIEEHEDQAKTEVSESSGLKRMHEEAAAARENYSRNAANGRADYMARDNEPENRADFKNQWKYGHAKVITSQQELDNLEEGYNETLLIDFGEENNKAVIPSTIVAPVIIAESRSAEVYAKTFVEAEENSTVEMHSDGTIISYNANISLYNNSSAEVYGTKSHVESHDDSFVRVYNGTADIHDTGRVEVYRNAQVELHNNSFAESYGDSRITAFDTSRTVLYDNSRAQVFDNTQTKTYEFASVVSMGGATVISHDNSVVEAYENSKITASDHSSVTAFDNSELRVEGQSSVVAFGETTVEARGNAYVEANNHTRTFLYENSSANVRENSRVNAYDEAYVSAYGNSYVSLQGNSTAVISENTNARAFHDSSVNVRESGPAETPRVILYDNSARADITEEGTERKETRSEFVASDHARESYTARFSLAASISGEAVLGGAALENITESVFSQYSGRNDRFNEPETDRYQEAKEKARERLREKYTVKEEAEEPHHVEITSALKQAREEAALERKQYAQRNLDSRAVARENENRTFESKNTFDSQWKYGHVKLNKTESVDLSVSPGENYSAEDNSGHGYVNRSTRNEDVSRKGTVPYETGTDRSGQAPLSDLEITAGQKYESHAEDYDSTYKERGNNQENTAAIGDVTEREYSSTAGTQDISGQHAPEGHSEPMPGGSSGPEVSTAAAGEMAGSSLYGQETALDRNNDYTSSPTADVKDNSVAPPEYAEEKAHEAAAHNQEPHTEEYHHEEIPAENNHGETLSYQEEPHFESEGHENAGTPYDSERETNPYNTQPAQERDAEPTAERRDETSYSERPLDERSLDEHPADEHHTDYNQSTGASEISENRTENEYHGGKIEDRTPDRTDERTPKDIGTESTPYNAAGSNHTFNENYQYSERESETDRRYETQNRTQDIPGDYQGAGREEAQRPSNTGYEQTSNQTEPQTERPQEDQFVNNEIPEGKSGIEKAAGTLAGAAAVILNREEAGALDRSEDNLSGTTAHPTSADRVESATGSDHSYTAEPTDAGRESSLGHTVEQSYKTSEARTETSRDYGSYESGKTEQSRSMRDGDVYGHRDDTRHESNNISGQESNRPEESHSGSYPPESTKYDTAGQSPVNKNEPGYSTGGYRSPGEIVSDRERTKTNTQPSYQESVVTRQENGPVPQSNEPRNNASEGSFSQYAKTEHSFEQHTFTQDTQSGRLEGRPYNSYSNATKVEVWEQEQKPTRRDETSSHGSYGSDSVYGTSRDYGDRNGQSESSGPAEASSSKHGYVPQPASENRSETSRNSGAEPGTRTERSAPAAGTTASQHSISGQERTKARRETEYNRTDNTRQDSGRDSSTTYAGAAYAGSTIGGAGQSSEHGTNSVSGNVRADAKSGNEQSRGNTGRDSGTFTKAGATGRMAESDTNKGQVNTPNTVQNTRSDNTGRSQTGGERYSSAQKVETWQQSTPSSRNFGNENGGRTETGTQNTPERGYSSNRTGASIPSGSESGRTQQPNREDRNVNQQPGGTASQKTGAFTQAGARGRMEETTAQRSATNDRAGNVQSDSARSGQMESRNNEAGNQAGKYTAAQKVETWQQNERKSQNDGTNMQGHSNVSNDRRRAQELQRGSSLSDKDTADTSDLNRNKTGQKLTGATVVLGGAAMVSEGIREKVTRDSNTRSNAADTNDLRSGTNRYNNAKKVEAWEQKSSATRQQNEAKNPVLNNAGRTASGTVNSSTRGLAGRHTDPNVTNITTGRDLFKNYDESKVKHRETSRSSIYQDQRINAEFSERMQKASGGKNGNEILRSAGTVTASNKGNAPQLKDARFHVVGAENFSTFKQNAKQTPDKITRENLSKARGDGDKNGVAGTKDKSASSNNFVVPVNKHKTETSNGNSGGTRRVEAYRLTLADNGFLQWVTMGVIKATGEYTAGIYGDEWRRFNSLGKATYGVRTTLYTYGLKAAQPSLEASFYTRLNKKAEKNRKKGIQDISGILGLDFSSREKGNASKQNLDRMLINLGLASRRYHNGRFFMDYTKLKAAYKNGTLEHTLRLDARFKNLSDTEMKQVAEDLNKMAGGLSKIDMNKAEVGRSGVALRRVIVNFVVSSDEIMKQSVETIRSTKSAIKSSFRAARTSALFVTRGGAWVSRKVYTITYKISQHTPLKEKMEKVDSKLGKIQNEYNKKIDAAKERNNARAEAKAKEKAEKKERTKNKRKESLDKLSQRLPAPIYDFSKRIGLATDRIKSVIENIKEKLSAPFQLFSLYGRAKATVRRWLIIGAGAFILFYFLLAGLGAAATDVVVYINSFTTDDDDEDIENIYDSTMGKALKWLEEAEIKWANSLKNIDEETDVFSAGLYYGSDYLTGDEYVETMDTDDMLSYVEDGNSAYFVGNPFANYNLSDDEMDELGKNITEIDGGVEVIFEGIGSTRTSNIKDILCMAATYFANDTIAEDENTDTSDTEETINAEPSGLTYAENDETFDVTVTSGVLKSYAQDLFNASHNDVIDLEYVILPTIHTDTGTTPTVDESVDSQTEEVIYCTDYDDGGCMSWDGFYIRSYDSDGEAEAYVKEQDGNYAKVSSSVGIMDEDEYCLPEGDITLATALENNAVYNYACFAINRIHTNTTDLGWYSEDDSGPDEPENGSTDSAVAALLSAKGVSYDFVEIDSGTTGTSFEAKIKVWIEKTEETGTSGSWEPIYDVTGEFDGVSYPIIGWEWVETEVNGYRYTLHEEYVSFYWDCAGVHTGYYCGGHLKADITGLIYTFTDEQIEDPDAVEGKVEEGEYVHTNVWKTKFDETIYETAEDLFDIDAAMIHTSEMEDWEGWTEDNMSLALYKYNMDWEELYGITLGSALGGSGSTASSVGGTALSDVQIDGILEIILEQYPDLSEERIEVLSYALSFVGNMGYSQAHHSCPLGSSCHLTDCSGFASGVWADRLGTIYSTYTFKSTFQNTAAWSSFSSGTAEPGDILLHYPSSGSNHAIVYLGRFSYDGSEVRDWCVECTSRNAGGNVYIYSYSSTYYNECYVLKPDMIG